MTDAEIAYDHINKRLVAFLDGASCSVPVTVQGTKHASLSAAKIHEKTAGLIPPEEFVRVLKRYRNNAGKSFIVTLLP